MKFLKHKKNTRHSLALFSMVICLMLNQASAKAEPNAEKATKSDEKTEQTEQSAKKPIVPSVELQKADQIQTLLPDASKPPVKTDEPPSEKPLTLQDRLADAALKRTTNLVIYNPKYYKIPYPGGDVPAHFGVCTDVIIRSYRVVGIDLQKDVHQKLGGDANIAHRRVKVLEKLFKRYGTTLPITKDPKDYKPGDIVTYFLEEAISSQDHIAIISNKMGTSGAPMIIHNIGLGPKLDDDLFSFKITGHYRYGK